MARPFQKIVSSKFAKLNDQRVLAIFSVFKHSNIKAELNLIELDGDFPWGSVVFNHDSPSALKLSKMDHMKKCKGKSGPKLDGKRVKQDLSFSMDLSAVIHHLW